MSAAVGLATGGVHGSWDVIVAVAVGAYLLSLVAILAVAYRSRARGDREATRQGRLFTVLVIALTILLLIPDDTSDRAIWAWTTQRVVVVHRAAARGGEVRR